MKNTHAADSGANGTNPSNGSLGPHDNGVTTGLQGLGKEQPLTILIVGAGIGGLTAGIALRQAGHIVKIFESSGFASETGAAIHLPPNTNGIMRRLGIIAQDFGSNPMCMMKESDGQGNVIRGMDMRKMNKIWQHAWLLAHRIHLHDALKRMAISEAGEGRPCELHTRSRVQNVDEVNGVITFEHGGTATGGVVIGADGVHSIARNSIDPDTKPFGSGKSAFRFLIPKETIKNDPITSHLVDEDGELKIWYEDDRRIVMYPTSNNTILNFVCIHPSSESDASADWNQDASLQTLLKVHSTCDKSLQAMLAKAEPSTIKAWVLLDMDEIPV